MKTGLCKYINFYTEANQQPVPVCDGTLQFFATHLAQQNLLYATIQIYLSAVRYNHIIAGESMSLITPRFDYVLKRHTQVKCYYPST